MPYATYADYLRSPVWAAIRARKLAAANYRCQTCGSTWQLQVHHPDYDAPWGSAEEERRLVVLCKFCHELFHAAQSRRADILSDIEKRITTLEVMP